MDGQDLVARQGEQVAAGRFAPFFEVQVAAVPEGSVQLAVRVIRDQTDAELTLGMAGVCEDDRLDHDPAVGLSDGLQRLGTTPYESSLKTGSWKGVPPA